MQYDYRKLNGRIKEVFGSQKEFSISMKLSEKTISNKLNNKLSWTQREIDDACKLLDIKPNKIQHYFFKKRVQ